MKIHPPLSISYQPQSALKSMHYAMCACDLFAGIDDLYYGYDPQNGTVFYIGFESPALLYPHCVLTHLCNQNIEQHAADGYADTDQERWK